MTADPYQQTLNAKHFRVDETTPAYSRVAHAGFVITSCRLEQHQKLSCIRLKFMCRCGREENILLLGNKVAQYLHNGDIDAAAMIEDAGALSAEHLRKDGYSEQEIAAIRTGL